MCSKNINRNWISNYATIYPYHRHSFSKMVRTSGEKVNQTPNVLKLKSYWDAKIRQLCTLSELCMLRVDSTLQHESVRRLSSRESRKGWGVSVSTRTVTPSAIGSSSLSKKVRIDFLLEDESMKCTVLKEEFKLTRIKLSERISCEEMNLRGETIPRLKSRPHFVSWLEE